MTATWIYSHACELIKINNVKWEVPQPNINHRMKCLINNKKKLNKSPNSNQALIPITTIPTAILASHSGRTRRVSSLTANKVGQIVRIGEGEERGRWKWRWSSDLGFGIERKEENEVNLGKKLIKEWERRNKWRKMKKWRDYREKERQCQLTRVRRGPSIGPADMVGRSGCEKNSPELVRIWFGFPAIGPPLMGEFGSGSRHSWIQHGWISCTNHGKKTHILVFLVMKEKVLLLDAGRFSFLGFSRFGSCGFGVSLWSIWFW